MEPNQALTDFRERGFAVIANVLTPDHSEALLTALTELAGVQPQRIHNVADILGLRDAFLDLVDLPAILPVIRQLLGNNIWVNHSHYNVNPPDSWVNTSDRETGYGWHRDGGAINQDLPKPGPLLSIKVGFYLSDLSEPGRGQTYVLPGSHKTDERTPANDVLPAAAHPVCLPPGSALLFDRRLIHSIRSDNLSTITRKAVFIQYAHRWLCPVDAMTVEHLRDRCNPVRRQLLGLTANYNVIDGAAGRSSAYYPRRADVPVSGTDGVTARRMLGKLRRRLARLLRR